MEADWRKSTEEDRRLLFKAVDALCWELDIDVNEVMNRVHGKPYAISSHFIGNFRRGKIDRRATKKIYDWLCKEHPESARSVEGGLDDLTPKSFIGAARKAAIWAATEYEDDSHDSWNKLIEHDAIDGHVEVCLLGPDSSENHAPRASISSNKGNVHLTGPQPILAGHVVPSIPGAVASLDIRLGQEFYFQLKTGHKGALLGFQYIGGNWRLLALAARSFIPFKRRGVSVPLTGEQQNFPMHPTTGKITGLCENTDIGKHGFIFLIADTEFIAVIGSRFKDNEVIYESDLDQLAAELASMPGLWVMPRLNVRFTA